ncbi:hypothetical protein GTY77_13910, partial [Streptomyces sp. SID8380]|nr:hypothetical protein [Streptomyces sp. SID8380]
MPPVRGGAGRPGARTPSRSAHPVRSPPRKPPFPLAPPDVSGTCSHEPMLEDLRDSAPAHPATSAFAVPDAVTAL